MVLHIDNDEKYRAIEPDIIRNPTPQGITTEMYYQIFQIFYIYISSYLFLYFCRCQWPLGLHEYILFKYIYIYAERKNAAIGKKR